MEHAAIVIFGLIVLGIAFIGVFMAGWFIGDMLKNLWRDE